MVEKTNSEMLADIILRDTIEHSGYDNKKKLRDELAHFERNRHGDQVKGIIDGYVDLIHANIPLGQALKLFKEFEAKRVGLTLNSEEVTQILIDKFNEYLKISDADPNDKTDFINQLLNRSK
ncbi:MAG: hypothetical protein ABI425_02650 [Patescibacteria group bacterium]